MLFQNRKFVILVALASLLILIAIFSLRGQVLSSSLKIDTAPSGSKLVLNGKTVNEGTIRVKPGTYKLVVSHPGFETVTRTSIVKKGQTAYMGVVLTSNAISTAHWYDKHPEDGQKAEGISSKTFVDIGDTQAKNLPLIKKLPYSERQFSIAYGTSQLTPDDPTKVAIYITYYTEEGKQEALTWIESQGFNLAKLEIVYKPSSFTSEQ